MHIVYLHQYFLTPDMAGGTRSFEMARRWVKAGHRVSMITTDQEVKASGRGWRVTTESGISVHWLQVPYSNEMGFWRRIAAFFRFALYAGFRAKQVGGDIIFATSTPLTIAIPAIYASRTLNIPMVFEVRDLWPEIPIALGVIRSRFLIFAARRLEKFAYQSSAAVIALSEGMAEGVARCGYPTENITVIPNSCDVALFQNHSNSSPFKSPEMIEWINSGAVVLYAGTIGKINGLKALVDIGAAAKVAGYALRFLIVGAGAERRPLQRYAEQSGAIGDYIRFLDPLPKKDVPALMNIATIATSFVLPLNELESNSANKFFDALASGKPIMINHGGWQQRILDSSGAGFSIKGLTPTEAAKVIADFSSDKQRVKIAGDAALRLAYTCFDRNQLASDLLAVLERVAFGHRKQ